MSSKGGGGGGGFDLFVGASFLCDFSEEGDEREKGDRYDTLAFDYIGAQNFLGTGVDGWAWIWGGESVCFGFGVGELMMMLMTTVLGTDGGRLGEYSLLRISSTCFWME